MKTNELNFARLSINIYLEMILRFAALFINTIMINFYNVYLLGAMSAANQIFSLTTTVFTFLSIGSSVLISQALGANDKNLAIRAAHTSFAFNLLLGIGAFCLCFFASTWLLRSLNVPQEVFADAKTYLEAISFVMLIDCASIVLSSIIRTYAKSKELMLCSLAMNALNIALNALFLFHFHLGLLGVGYSSIISRLVCFFLFVFIYFKVAKLHIYVELFFKIKLEILRKILKIGGFSAGENLLWSAQYVVVFSFVAKLGAASLSMQTLYFQISMFIFMCASAISVANEILIGRFVGAKEIDKAYHQGFKALKIALFCSLVNVTLVLIFSETLIELLDLPTELRGLIRPLFLISIILETSRALNIVMVNSLRASGDAAFPFYMGIIFMWGCSVPLAYLFAITLGIGLKGVWFAFCVDEFLRGLCNTYRWKSKKWSKKALV